MTSCHIHTADLIHSLFSVHHLRCRDYSSQWVPPSEAEWLPENFELVCHYLQAARDVELLICQRQSSTTANCRREHGGRVAQKFVGLLVTHWGPVITYGVTDHGQHYLSWWLVAWQPQMNTWTSADLLSVTYTGTHFTAFSLEFFSLLIRRLMA